MSNKELPKSVKTYIDFLESKQEGIAEAYESEVRKYTDLNNDLNNKIINFLKRIKGWGEKPFKEGEHIHFKGKDYLVDGLSEMLSNQLSLIVNELKELQNDT